MPAPTNHGKPPKSMRSRVFYWVLSLAVMVIAGTVFVLMLGGVQGSEIDPIRFASRSFFYYRLPFTRLQISPTWYDPSSGQFENDIAPYLPTNQSRKRHWQVASVHYGAVSNHGDSKIMDDLFWIVDNGGRSNSTFWTTWSNDNKKVAKLFWPMVSEIGVSDAYLILPDFVKATLKVTSTEEFQRDVIPLLVSSYNELATNFAEAESHDRVIDLTTLAIKHDAKNEKAFELRAEANRQLGNTELAQEDLATSRALE
ncbi:type IV pilus biogenesis/stability protein PilW [Planctomycetota bacterium]